MMTTTLSTRNDNHFEDGKDLEKVTLAPSAAQGVQEWFNAQTLPGLPLHLELLLVGMWEAES